jgi:hypothetical protein
MITSYASIGALPLFVLLVVILFVISGYDYLRKRRPQDIH